MSDRSETSPAHAPKRKRPVAAALAYDAERDRAPKVVAAGRGEIAERIILLAESQGIPVREDPDLMAMLEAIDVGDEIPVEAFAAVAEILVYLFRTNARLASSATPTHTEDHE
ncbi:MAG: EscU/YscU/HrcU family type III secretion system export apparatus switch protein [Hyphomicrobiales bacterium]|nr:EscU/YscU/HrcU family type III secretion system export apparatus switch protein [Hyphomicrobiales bacterium]